MIATTHEFFHMYYCLRHFMRDSSDPMPPTFLQLLSVRAFSISRKVFPKLPKRKFAHSEVSSGRVIIVFFDLTWALHRYLVPKFQFLSSQFSLIVSHLQPPVTFWGCATQDKWFKTSLKIKNVCILSRSKVFFYKSVYEVLLRLITCKTQNQRNFSSFRLNSTNIYPGRGHTKSRTTNVLEICVSVLFCLTLP